jgi:hypothetical protein
MLALVALIHAIDGPPGLDESYTIGALELALTLAVVPLGIALLICPVRDVWIASAVLCAVALGFYVASRTVGLAGMSDDIGDWFSLLGVLNVLAELAVIGIAGRVLLSER